MGRGGYRAEPQPLAATLACNVISCVLAHWAPLSPPHNSPGSSLLSVLTLWNRCIKWLVKFEISLQCQEVAGISIRAALQVGLGYSWASFLKTHPWRFVASAAWAQGRRGPGCPRCGGGRGLLEHQGTLKPGCGHRRTPLPSHLEYTPGQNHLPKRTSPFLPVQKPSYFPTKSAC